MCEIEFRLSIQPVQFLKSSYIRVSDNNFRQMVETKQNDIFERIVSFLHLYILIVVFQKTYVRINLYCISILKINIALMYM